MKKIALILGIVLTALPGFATDITWSDKTTGGTFSAADANEVKTAVNSKANALGTDDNYVTDAEKTRIGNLEATDNVTFGNVTASGGTLSAGVANTTQGALVLYTNTDPIYTFSFLPAATPSAIVSIKGPPAMPGGSNYLWNVDANGTSDWTNPATFEPALGNPTTTGYVLSSTDAGVRSWIANGAGSMTYPGAGIPLSTGSAWGTSYSLTTLAAALDGEAWTFTGAVDMSGASSVTMGPICFEGSSVDANDTCFSVTNPTAPRDIALGNFGMAIPAATSVDASGNILIAGIADSTTEALGIGTIELGHASDTTIARSGAGAVTIEGVGVSMNSTSATHTASTLELGAASDTTLARGAAGRPTVEGLYLPRIVASGSVAFNPNSVNDGACSAATDGGTATGTATTDTINWNFSGTPTSTTGYNPSGNLGYIIAYPTADHVNFIFCNKSGSAIDADSVTLNWMVLRP